MHPPRIRNTRSAEGYVVAVQLVVCTGLPDLSAKVLTFRQPSPGRLISLFAVSRRVLGNWLAARWCCDCTHCHCMAEEVTTSCSSQPRNQRPMGVELGWWPLGLEARRTSASPGPGPHKTVLQHSRHRAC